MNLPAVNLLPILLRKTIITSQVSVFYLNRVTLSLLALFTSISPVNFQVVTDCEDIRTLDIKTDSQLQQTIDCLQ